MTLGWWARLVAWFTGDSFRERHERMTEEARKRAAAAGKLYDAYPDTDSPDVIGDYARYWVNISTKGPDGKLLVEPMRMAWPLALSNVDKVEVQFRLIQEFLKAYKALRARRSAAWDTKRG